MVGFGIAFFLRLLENRIFTNSNWINSFQLFTRQVAFAKPKQVFFTNWCSGQLITSRLFQIHQLLYRQLEFEPRL